MLLLTQRADKKQKDEDSDSEDEEEEIEYVEDGDVELDESDLEDLADGEETTFWANLLRYASYYFSVLLGTAGCRRAANRAGAVAAVPVQTAVAVQRDVPRQVEAIGTVQALRTVSVKSQVDGIIASVNFTEGEDVKAGDLLVSLDRRPFENSLRSARADVAT